MQPIEERIAKFQATNQDYTLIDDTLIDNIITQFGGAKAFAELVDTIMCDGVTFGLKPFSSRDDISKFWNHNKVAVIEAVEALSLHFERSPDLFVLESHHITQFESSGGKSIGFDAINAVLESKDAALDQDIRNIIIQACVFIAVDEVFYDYHRWNKHQIN